MGVPACVVPHRSDEVTQAEPGVKQPGLLSLLCPHGRLLPAHIRNVEGDVRGMVPAININININVHCCEH